MIVGGPCCYLDQNRFLASIVVRQLACDATLTVVTEDDEGHILNIGRRSRKISRAMRLALSIRDGGCRFPGCHQRTWTDAHHIHHWADGGETNLDNLITLCRHHHRLLHHGDYKIRQEGKAVAFLRKVPCCRLPCAFTPQFEAAGPDIVIGRIRLDLEADGITIDENTAFTKRDGGTCDYGRPIEGLYRQDGLTGSANTGHMR